MPATIQTIETPKRARALDTSGNNNHGQIYSGRALEFDGVADYLTLSSGNDYLAANGASNTITSNPWTMAIWFKADDIDNNTNQPIMGWLSNSSTAYGTGIMLKDNGDIFANHANNNAAFHDDRAVGIAKEGTWYRAVATSTGEGAGNTIKLYINGIEVQSTTSTTDNYSYHFAIGAGIQAADTVNGYFEGKLSDAQIWNAVWTQSDVTYDYLNPEQLALNNGGTSLTESNLKLWYPMQDGHRGQQSYILDGANVAPSSKNHATTAFYGDELITVSDDRTLGASHNWVVTDAQWAYDGTNDELDYTAGAAGSTYLRSAPALITGRRYRLVFENDTAASTKITIKDGVGSEMISIANDRVFDAIDGSTGWTAGTNMTISSNSGKLKVLNSASGTSDTFCSYAFTTVVGVSYNAKVTLKTEVGLHGEVYINNSVAPTGSLASVTSINPADATANVDIVFTATATTTYLILKHNSAGNNKYTEWDDASIKPLGVNTLVAEATYTDGTKTVDFEATSSNTGLTITAAADSGAFSIESFTVKEEGTATGWTDADQQLDIPQITLQSYNQLAWFDGQNGNDATLDSQIDTSTNNWSISFWVFHKDAGQTFDFVIGSGATKNISFDNNSARKLYYRQASGGTYQAISDAEIPQGEWVHIVITAIADTSITAYVNGITQTTNSSMSATQLVIDRFMEGYTAGTLETLGSITEISYYDDVLTESEAQDLYNDGKAKSALDADGSGNLVGYWRNNGLAEWEDLKGSNDANTNGVTETLLLPAGVDSSRDNQGFIMNRQRDTNSLNLTTAGGTVSYVAIPETTYDVDGTACSFSFWIKRNSTINSNGTSNWNTILGNSGVNAYKWIAINTGYTQLHIEGDTNTDGAYATFTALTLDTWYNFAIVCNGSGAVAMYKNGVTTGMSMTDSSIGVNLTINQIGRAYDSTYESDAQLDDILIYDGKALSAPEVLRNYKAGKRSHR